MSCNKCGCVLCSHPLFWRRVHRSWILSPPSLPPTYTIIYVTTTAQVCPSPLYYQQYAFHHLQRRTRGQFHITGIYQNWSSHSAFILVYTADVTPKTSWLKRRQIYIWTNNFLPLWFCSIASFVLSRSSGTKLNLFHSLSFNYGTWKHWTILLLDCDEHCPSACEGWLPATGKWAQK